MMTGEITLSVYVIFLADEITELQPLPDSLFFIVLLK